jgi:hypothetical protein
MNKKVLLIFGNFFNHFHYIINIKGDMNMCEMKGFATSNELFNLYKDLKLKTPEERAEIGFALFVAEKGMLNGNEALEYLENKFSK